MRDRTDNTGNIRIEVIRDFEALEPFAEAWNKLALEAPQGIPMLSHAWVATHFESFMEPGESWFCLLALRDEELVGVLPAVVTPEEHAGFDLPLIRAPFNLYTASVDFVIRADMYDKVVNLFLTRLDSAAGPRLALELLRIPAASLTIPALAKSFNGSTVIREFNGRGSFLETSGSFEEYYSGLGHNFSRNLTKARNKVAKLPNVKILFLSGAEAGEKEIENFLKVEAAGWKGRGGTAVISSPASRAFYTSLARRLSKLGWMEWHFLLTDGRPIAAHFAIKTGRTLVVNKIGYDEEFSKCSPGNILFEHTVRRAFESRDTDEINCLTDMAWHDNWKMIKKDYYDFWIYPRRPLPYIFGVMPKKIRRWGRHMPAVKSLYKMIRSVAKKA